MRGVLGVVLSACLLVGCGGVEEGVELQPGDAPAEVEATAAPLPPPYCDSYVGDACSKLGDRVDCMWDWTEMSSCYCNGSTWQCT